MPQETIYSKLDGELCALAKAATSKLIDRGIVSVILETKEVIVLRKEDGIR